MTEITQTVQLGTTDIFIPAMGIGTWSWGDRTFWSYGVTHSSQDVEEAFNVCIEAGFNFFDTASIYGFGQNESVLGLLIKGIEKSTIIASKGFPFPWRLTTGSILGAIKSSADRLGYKPIDLYQHHWPLSLMSIEHWMRAFAYAHEQGFIRAIGASNYNLKNMIRAKVELAKFGLPLASNQVHFSLLHHSPISSGLLQACKEEGITLLAYSPLGQGLLTGKYTPDSPTPKGMMRLGDQKVIQRIQPLLDKMRQIGQDHGGKTPAQVAINWVICKGAVPLVGAKNARQAKENLGALGWHLTVEQVAILDMTSQEIQISFPMEPLVGLS